MTTTPQGVVELFLLAGSAASKSETLARQAKDLSMRHALASYECELHFQSR